MINYLKNKDSIILFFFVLTFISSSIFEKNLFGIGVDLFANMFFIFYFLFFIKWSQNFAKKYVYLLLTFIFFQIFICTLNDFSFFGLTKQIVPILIIYTSTYFIITNYGLKRILSIYESIVILLCLFGIFQIFLNYFDISIYQKEQWRMNSLIKEPSHFGMLILPIVLKFIFEFKKLNIKLIILLFSLFWTLSVSVIFSLLISIVLFHVWKLFNSDNKFFLKPKYSLYSIILTFIFVLITIIYMNYSDSHSSGTLNALVNSKFHFIINDEIANREYNYKQLFNNIIFNDEFYDVIQLSINSVVSIIKVGINILYQNPFGAGLGSNEEAFYLFKEIYINNTFKPFNTGESNLIKRFNFASKTSQSLLMRMIIEFGIIFIIFIFILIQKMIAKFIFFSKEKAIIFLSLFSVIIFKITKLASYIDYGTGFFLISIVIMLFKDNEFDRNFN